MPAAFSAPNAPTAFLRLPSDGFFLIQVPDNSSSYPSIQHRKPAMSLIFAVLLAVRDALVHDLAFGAKEWLKRLRLGQFDMAILKKNAMH